MDLEFSTRTDAHHGRAGPGSRARARGHARRSAGPRRHAHTRESAGAPRAGPDRARPSARAARALLRALAAPLFQRASPGYLAYIPGGGLYPAALADFIADTTNRYTGVWQAAPALVQLEANALDWLRDWMRFPATARGLFTTGGSMANFNAILCARERHLGPDIRRGVLYTSTQVHHSVLKSAQAGRHHARPRARDPGRRRTSACACDALRQAIAADRAAGLAPFLVVSTAGTTNTGAVDPLDAIADLCAARGAVAPRRRRLRRVLPPLRRSCAAARRPVARGLADARPAQGPVPALRHRRAAGARRRGAARRARRPTPATCPACRTRRVLRSRASTVRTSRAAFRGCACGCA